MGFVAYFGVILLFLVYPSFTPFLLSVFFCYVLYRNRRTIFSVLETLPRDLHLIWLMGRLLVRLKMCQMRDDSIPTVFSRTAAKYGDKIGLRHLDKALTYRQVDEMSNRVANSLLEMGYSRGDVIGVYMDGCCEYPVVWLGVVKAGMVASLLNTNLSGAALSHCIGASRVRAVVFSPGSEPRLDSMKTIPLPTLLSSPSTPPDCLPPSYADVAIHIFTSGTTGLPKAAVVNHARGLYMLHVPGLLLGLRPSDVLYTPLPLYHTAGGMLGMGFFIISGGTIVIRSKFSASNFWKDCRQYGCTAAQYIGETCRYLLAQPQSPEDLEHRVRVMFGNGLRPQIWELFRTRFGIRKILEFYGATEGNGNLFNAWGKPGAVGYVPWLAKSFYRVELVRMDEASEDPIRGSDGLCLSCSTGEPGLLVAPINSKRPETDFKGYSDKAATEKKILRNVLVKGDRAFNTGDVLIRDELGYFYFKDRKGDTFRWKGENVSTEEVEAAICGIVGQKDAVVYGVEVPGSEGRAGMAALVAGHDDVQKLGAQLSSVLPQYARPLFIRLCTNLPVTSTYKLQKYQLAGENFDPTKVQDPLYFMDPSTRQYRALTEPLYRDILHGKCRL